MLEKDQSLELLTAKLDSLREEGRSVDMTRGRPSKEQLDIALPMLKDADSATFTYAGGDARNYGDMLGAPAARALFGELFGVPASNVAVFDGSSLAIMYKLIAFAMDFGICKNAQWRQGKVKFLCPSPGYDRHFAICEEFGIDMIPVEMTPYGPDMDEVERLVKDECVKGMWCVPKYSNPTGIVYSDETVKRIASLRPAAKDFRVIWDNAYMVHSLLGDDELLNIFDEAKKYGNDDLVYEIASTSKITFAGSGVAALACSEQNLRDFASHMQYAMINPNKVNQILHVRFLKDKENIRKIMSAHAELLRPKFEYILARLGENFKKGEEVDWSVPKGGYFISLDVEECASRIVELAKYAGVKFTAAGATYPYHHDPLDKNLRIAPSVPSLDELRFATDVLVTAIKIALLEREK